MKRSLIISCSIALLAATTNFAQNAYTSNPDVHTSQEVTLLGENDPSPSFSQNGMTGNESGTHIKDHAFNLEQQITVYPNPTVGKVIVRIPAHIKLIGAQMLTQNGQLTDLPVPIWDNSGQSIEFDMSMERNRNPRILILKTNKGVFTKKIILTRN